MIRRKKILCYIWGSFAAIMLFIFLFWFFFLRHYKYTDDAYVHGNQVYITPLHPGFVTSVLFDDSFLVREGQLLVTLDETDSKIALQKAKEDLAQTVRDVCELFHQVFVYKAEIDLKTAQLICNAQDCFHREGVFRQQGVSVEDYQHALAALRTEFFSLKMSGALYHKTLAVVQDTTIHDHPLVMAAADKVRREWVRLVRCKIYSPVEGLVAQRTIQVGMWVPAGQPLMSVIPLDQIWVNANYKETQLKHIRLGQKVNVTADLWGFSHVFHGKVVGLPGGSGNAFSLLPPENLSGNWIKIVQRLPVRVRLDPEEVKKHPLRLGLTCRTWVDISDQEGKWVPTKVAGSPSYHTPIFKTEEAGDEEFIASIVSENIDPTLKKYAHEPLHLPGVKITLPPIIDEALRQNSQMEEQVLEYSESHDEMPLGEECKP
jgi:membrane fusion protein (multidrug efflux system)